MPRTGLLVAAIVSCRLGLVGLASGFSGKERVPWAIDKLLIP